MSSLVFTVRSVPAGWVVENHVPHGPFVTKERAVDLAEGMADALRRHGQSATVEIEDAASIMRGVG